MISSLSQVYKLSTICTFETKFEIDDDLSACPICNRRMKVEDVFLHLDTHQDIEEQNKLPKSKPPVIG